jgi:hypothetical protein
VPPPPGCPNGGPPSSEGTEAICRVPSASFSQAPWYLQPVHLCRFRVRSIWGGYFLEPLHRLINPIRSNDTRNPSHIPRLRTIHLIPIDYALRPRLRSRLTRSGLTLLRNPWTFGEGASHSLYRYSCQHSHSPYLHRPSPDGFSGLGDAPLPLRNQKPETRNQNSHSNLSSPIPAKSLQHPRDLMIVIAPQLPLNFINISQIQTKSAPHPHLIG